MESMENQFTARYLTYYVLVFLAFYEFFLIIPSKWIEMITAQASAYFLNQLNLNSNYGLYKDFVTLNLLGGARDVHVLIIRECTAIHVLGILMGMILPLQNGEMVRKAKAIVLGALMIFVMNIMRIMLTVYLTGYDVPPFSWFFTNPTVETYHYPISFFYGVVGIIIVIMTINQYILPELGQFLIELPTYISTVIKKQVRD